MFRYAGWLIGRLSIVGLVLLGCAKVGKTYAYSGSKFTLNEYQPWLTEYHGPAAARGVIPRHPTDDNFDGLPYFLGSLSHQGWDIIGAQVPHNAHYNKFDHRRFCAYAAGRARQPSQSGPDDKVRPFLRKRLIRSRSMEAIRASS